MKISLNLNSIVSGYDSNTNFQSLEYYKLALHQWRSQIKLRSREQIILGPELLIVDEQLKKLDKEYLEIATLGRVGVGKSSLLNALLGKSHFPTSIAHGSTRTQSSILWKDYIKGDNLVELIDTPGIDEISAAAREHLALRVALSAHMVLFVIDSDLTNIDLYHIKNLITWGKPVIVVLNRIDYYLEKEKNHLIDSIAAKLPKCQMGIKLVAVEAAPRIASLSPNGKFHGKRQPSRIESLKQVLKQDLEGYGKEMVILNAFQTVNQFNNLLCRWRLQQKKYSAQKIIGIYAIIGSLGIIVNPNISVDLIFILILNTILIYHLSEIYSLKLNESKLKRLIIKIATHITLFGGISLGIQLFLLFLNKDSSMLSPRSNNFYIFSTVTITISHIFSTIYICRSIGNLTAVELLCTDYLLTRKFIP
uniref:Possible GTPase n=1 Tax=Paulinella chromatophora TaxID=39717 RepID=B1X3Z0_PAUCH|nr:possible GTPase [Paulinella chromatophora]ACB42659.1 possible GTPase [Paulinella chromatophora]